MYITNKLGLSCAKLRRSLGKISAHANGGPRLRSAQARPSTQSPINFYVASFCRLTLKHLFVKEAANLVGSDVRLYVSNVLLSPPPP